MSFLAKYIIIDRASRKTGTYDRTVHELYSDGDPPSDLGELGLAIHNERFGVRDKRHFVRVLGIEEDGAGE